MPFGLLTGLTAALFWGTLDVITALASRVIGSLRVTAGMQSVTAVLFLVIFVATGTTIPTDPASIALAVLLGLIGAGAYLAYFTGLQFGPIAVVSGMVAAFGGLTVVLSVVIRGESLSPLQAFGAAIATVGVILTAFAFDGGLRATRFAGPGVVFALVALVLFSLMAITTDVALETMSWIQIYTIARVVNASIGIVVRARSSRGARGARSGIDRRAVPPGRTRASSAHSCSPECSTSWDWSPSRSGSRPLRPGWSGWRRRSVRRSRSWSPSRSSASGSTGPVVRAPRGPDRDDLYRPPVTATCVRPAG